MWLKVHKQLRKHRLLITFLNPNKKMNSDTSVFAVCQTSCGCSLTASMTRTSFRRMHSTSGRPAKIRQSRRAKALPSSRWRPSSRGYVRRRRSRRTIETCTSPTWQNVEHKRSVHDRWNSFFCGTVQKHGAIFSLDFNGGSTKYMYYT